MSKRNMITFAEEYREKGFEELPFCMVDSLIMSQIAYFNYGNSAFSQEFFQGKLCDFYREYPDIVMKGMLTTQGDKVLLEVLRKGGRHGNLRACCYVDQLDRAGEMQFAAITFELREGEYYIAFRGTDCSVVGWKEDFALSFQEVIPAQKVALEYARKVMSILPGRFYIGGHSKGGNLAIYAAAGLSAGMQRRIRKVYNFDGPGFQGEFYQSKGYQRIRPRICKIVPQSAIIGMMLESDSICRVVHSTAEAVAQHNPYSWVVSGRELEKADGVDALSGIIKRTLDGWLEVLSTEERKKIVNTVFDVIYGAGINLFYEIVEQRFEKIRALIDSASCVDQEERKRVYTALRRLLGITAEELHRAAKEEGAAQLEEYAVKLDKFLQSISTVSRSRWDKIK